MTVSPDAMLGAAALSKESDPRSVSEVDMADEDSNVPVEWVNRALAGRYRVLRTLGQGAMGSVLLAEHVGLQMPVALKVIHPRLALSSDAVARFQREAYLASRINHPNVVSIVDIGLLDDRVPYLVMQLVKGIDLRQVMASEQPLPWSAAASIGSQICDALAAARVHGIIHRDIKPANIVLEPVGKGREPLVKLLDFGVAKLEPDAQMQVGASQLTPFGVIVGTPGYMAPEQYVGEQVTHRSDLYALGIVLWELMTGDRLFPNASLADLLRLQMGASQRSIELRAHGVPPALENLIARLLSYAAIERPESASDVGAELRALSAEKDAPAWGALPEPDSAARAQPVAFDHTDGQDASTSIESRPKRRARDLGRAFWIGLACLGLGLSYLAGSLIAGKPVARDRGAVVPDLRTTRPVKADRDANLTAAHVDASIEARPDYLREIALLQDKRTCRGKLPHLRRLLSLEDPRTLPFLKSLAARPRTGCGPRHRQDCLACLRKELNAALITFQDPQRTAL